jgi:hypothetical protein
VCLSDTELLSLHLGSCAHTLTNQVHDVAVLSPPPATGWRFCIHCRACASAIAGRRHSVMHAPIGLLSNLM